ncbi:MAG: hypoxanthine phosphoribosyltransferase, partial [Acidobacteriota bacterium]
MTHPRDETRPPDPTVLIPRKRIEQRVAELGREIDAAYAGSEELVCIAVLKGAAFFLVDLVRALETPVAVDFLQTSSYGSRATPGEVRIRRDVDLPLRDRDVLLVEDIVDTGWTLETLLALLRLRRPRSLKLCALLDKPARREVEVPVDFLGFTVPDRFIVGYGLDHG